MTPFTTGRDNRSTLTITGRYCRGGGHLSGSSAKARSIPFPLRALVFLRDGLIADSTGRTLAGRVNRLRVAGVFVHLGGPLMSGQGAPGRICGQAIAQNHQGPRNLGRSMRASALLPLRWGSAAVSEVLLYGSALIIAPCREGSQAAPLPKLVSTKTANGGGEGQPLAA